MEEKLKARVREAVADLDVAGSILIVAHGNFFNDVVLEAIRDLTSRDHYGIYVSLNKPYHTVKEFLDGNGIDTSVLYFVDCITALVHDKLDRGVERVLFAEHPADIEKDGSIPKNISKFLGSIGEEKFVLIDALRTMLIYNEPKVVSTFIHNLFSETDKFNTKIIVLTREEHDLELIGKIRSLFDEILVL